MSEAFKSFRPESALSIGATPTKVVQHYHTFVMQCQCAARTVSVIVGDGVGIACPSCGGVPKAKLENAEVHVGFGRPIPELLIPN